MQGTATSDVRHDVANSVQNVAYAINSAKGISDLRKGNLQRHTNQDVEDTSEPVLLKDGQIFLNELAECEASTTEGKFQDADEDTKQDRNDATDEPKRPAPPKISIS